MPSITILQTPHIYELTAPVADAKRPVLVFVHGWLLSRRYWQPLVQLLKSEYQCLIYDARGFGESQTAYSPKSLATIDISHTYDINNGNGENKVSEARNYSLRAYAEDLNYLLEDLSIKHAWVVGHSLGGSVALWAAELYPEVIKGVICLNAGGGIYLKEEFERFRRVGQLGIFTHDGRTSFSFEMGSSEIARFYSG